MTAVDHRKPVRLAQAVLAAALEQRWPQVQRALERLNSECDAEGLGLALVAWCDAFAAHACDGIPEFGAVRLVGWNVDTGAIEPSARETVRWATELIQARARGDQDAFEALLDQLNAESDGWRRGRYVIELVESVALTIRSTPRGYARMGRPG